MLAWLALFLSWGSLGLETATVVVSRSRKTVMMKPGLRGSDDGLKDYEVNGTIVGGFGGL